MEIGVVMYIQSSVVLKRVQYLGAHDGSRVAWRPHGAARGTSRAGSPPPVALHPAPGRGRLQAPQPGDHVLTVLEAGESVLQTFLWTETVFHALKGAEPLYHALLGVKTLLGIPPLMKRVMGKRLWD